MDDRAPLVAAVLLRAAWRIRRGFTTGCLARDAEGRPVDPTSHLAVAWCAEGAIAAVAESRAEAEKAVRATCAASGLAAGGLTQWNDAEARDEEQVARLLEQASHRLSHEARPHHEGSAA